STAKLAEQVEAMIIIGVRNSSNTNKLYNISRRLLPRTYLIESPEEIKLEMLKDISRIGLSGGASTPPDVIKKTVTAIKNSFPKNLKQEKVTHE
ncbi:MAG: 4-hydroxy-3-methylbut-2-enyl diphosphate reductase, partial [Candidatus Aminicenantes bacterium]|nr:4-hydroxy-3-methylbut-2-enyl diphosphate reductase [Candidatus Aminicenantes bacterium]